MTPPPTDPGRDLAAEVAALGLGPLVEAAGETPVYLVGGAVRDLLLDRELGDVDVAVEGDAIALARRLVAGRAGARGLDEGGPPPPVAREHERFGTAKVELDGREVDLAATRFESYARPGALPEVGPAGIADDLARRDYTINAMAVPLGDPERLIDPHGGRDDLERGLLRVLHDGSFRDDPTRALRAARYAARFGFALEPGTERLLRAAELAAVSAERVEADLLRLADEEGWRRGFELLAGWGLATLGEPGEEESRERAARALERMQAVRETLAREPWRGLVPGGAAMLAAGEVRCGAYAAPPEPLREAQALVELKSVAPVERTVASEEGSRPIRPAPAETPPSRLAATARDASPLVLVLARALGAEWLDTYMSEWRHARLEIDGEDLLAAGIPQGPAVGRGLAAALAARLDQDVAGRDEQLRIALEAARD